MSQQILRSVLLCGSFLGNTLRINIWGRKGKEKREPGLIRGSWVVWGYSQITWWKVLKLVLPHIATRELDFYVLVLLVTGCGLPREGKDVEPGVRSCLQLKQFLERGDSWELSAMVIPRIRSFSPGGTPVGTPQCLVLRWRWDPRAMSFGLSLNVGAVGEKNIFFPEDSTRKIWR